jgi:hypothetical protein
MLNFHHLALDLVEQIFDQGAPTSAAGAAIVRS